MIKKRFLFGILPALIIIIFFVFLDFFLMIPVEKINDRLNYFEYILYSSEIFFGSISSPFPIILFEEPIFKLIMFSLSGLGISPDFTIRILVFIMLFTTFKILFKKTNISFFWILLILLTPVVMVNYVMTIRQGLATTIFLFGIFNIKDKKFQTLIFILLPLIHYSFYLVLFFYILSKLKYLQNFNNSKLYLFVVGIFSVFLSISILKLVTILSQTKMAEDYEMINESTLGFGLLFWFVILLLFLSEGKIFILKNLFELSILIFYVSSVTIFNPFSRVLQTASILILISGFQLTNFRLLLFKILIFLFVIYIVIYFLINGRLGLMTLPLNNE